MQNNEKNTPKGAKLTPKNAFAAIFKTNAKRQTLASFADEISDKPYFETHAGLYTLSKFGSVGTAIASMAMAYVYTNGLFTNLLPSSLSGFAPALAVGLLFGLEYLKREFFRNFCTEYVKRKQVKPVSLALGLALVVCSSLLSVFGVIDFVETKGSEAIQGIESTTQAQIQATKDEYSAKRESLEERRKAIVQRNTYKGKTWLPKSERQNVQALESALIALDKAEKQALLEVQSSSEVEMQASSEGTQDIALQMAIASALNEALCIFALFFMYSFKFRSLVELGLVSCENPMPALLKSKQVKPSSPVGFAAQSKGTEYDTQYDTEYDTQYPNENTEILSANTENEFAHHELQSLKKSLIQDLLQGERDYRTLTQRHKVNIKTVQAHLRFVDTLN